MESKHHSTQELKAWVTTHKKQLILFAGIGIAAVVGVKGLVPKEPPKHSLEWIRNLSDSEWETERKKVLDDLRNPELDDLFRENCRRILDLFDKVKSARDWAGETPRGPANRPENGWYLLNKD